MSSDVTVCIPSIPPRGHLLNRALASVTRQSRPPDAISVAIDHLRQGAAATRNRAWRAATTEFVAFLDDDDEFHAHHLEHLLNVQSETSADLVYPWHRIIGPDGHTQLPDLLNSKGLAFDPIELEIRNYIPITLLVRRSLLEEVDGFPLPFSERWPCQDCEDWACWKSLSAAGAKFVHTPEETWDWHHHGYNTSGMSTNW